MDIPRFHCDSPLTTGLCVELSLAEAHHAMHVLRLRAGADVELFNGRGQSAAGRIVQAKHGRVQCEVGAVGAAQDRRGARVHVAFAVPKGKRLDWLLEKATELAAASLWPVVFERSVAGGKARGRDALETHGRDAHATHGLEARATLDGGDEVDGTKRERWLGHCVAAAKQSGVNFLPELRETLSLAELLSVTAPAADAGTLLRLAGDITADTVPLAKALAGACTWHGRPAHVSRGRPALADPEGRFDCPCSQDIFARLCGVEILLIIGPEGGLTDAERQQLAAACVTPVRLGHSVLRIETAAVALLAAVTAMVPYGL